MTTTAKAIKRYIATTRQERDARVRAHLCLFPGCERTTKDPGLAPWTMCRRHHSAGGPVMNYWRKSR